MAPNDPAIPTDTVDAILTAAVAHGLDGAPEWPSGPFDDDTIRRAVLRAREHRLVGALAEAAFHGAFLLSDEQLALLADYHAGAQSHVLELERALGKVAAVFDAAGVETRVLKGLALARTIYDDPSWRVASDLDLLVPSASFDMAVAMATASHGLDGTQNVVELRPGFDAEFGKEALIRLGDLELDLHRTFVAGPFGHTIDLDELFADSTTFTVAGRTHHTLSPHFQLLHACYNTALGDYPVRLCAVRDLLLCHRRLDADLGAVIETARRWGGLAVVQRAGELIVDAVGPTIAGELRRLAELDVPRRERWLLRAYLTPARSYSRPLASLAVIPGVRARLRYLRAIAVPSRHYLRSRGWTTRTHLRRAIDRLRHD